jgi:hypothetical protein
MSRETIPESVLKAALEGAFRGRRQMQGHIDQLNPTPDGRPVTDHLTLALLVSCFGRNRAIQSTTFRDFREEVRGGPPNRKATGSDMIAQLDLPPEASVRVSYREHRIRATLSAPGMMMGNGDMLILNDHAPVSLTTGWSARIADVNAPLTLADVVPGLPDLLVSTLTRGDTHVMLQYVDEDVPWDVAAQMIAMRITDRTEGQA